MSNKSQTLARVDWHSVGIEDDGQPILRLLLRLRLRLLLLWFAIPLVLRLALFSLLRPDETAFLGATKSMGIHLHPDGRKNEKTLARRALSAKVSNDESSLHMAIRARACR